MDFAQPDLQKYIKLVENEIERVQKQQTLTFEEAFAQAYQDYGAFPGFQEAFDETKRIHDEALLLTRTLTEKGNARKDHERREWYAEPTDESGCWPQLKANMLAGKMRNAVAGVESSSLNIVRDLAEPGADRDVRQGLVIGNVQSGKTANYAAVIARAVDAGYKLVIVLAGIHNNLRKQTQERLNRDLGVRPNSLWRFLTTTHEDFGPYRVGHADRDVDAPTLIVIKKNATRLRNLKGFLEQISEQQLKRTPVLIIDDESDQATPDGSPKIDDEVTTINGLLTDIWSIVRNGTYVGYTATPFANILMDPNSATETRRSLYPDHFIHVMDTPKEYFGAERIFGLNPLHDESEEDLASSSTDRRLDVVRDIDETELDDLYPASRKDKDSFEAEITPSLSLAIRWFIIASAIRLYRGQGSEHSSMLVHTTQLVAPHFAMQEAIRGFLEDLRDEVHDDNFGSFEQLFKKEFPRASNLYKGTEPHPKWKDVNGYILNVLNRVETVVDNGKEDPEQRLHYPATEDDSPGRIVIVVGGGTLSRGLTLEGLFVSFFTRRSNTYDTLLQMGRWFGYRSGYEDLQRIWLGPGLESDYAFLASVEAELREEIKSMIAQDMRPDQVGVKVRTHPGRLDITSPGKMKHADHQIIDFSGASRIQTHILDVSSDTVIEKNAVAAETLINKISDHHVPSDANGELYLDVPVNEVRNFIDNFTTASTLDKYFDRAISWAEEKLPDTGWNIVVANGTSRRTFEFGSQGQWTVQKVTRTALAREAKGQHTSNEINLGSLMAGNHPILDMRLLAKAKNVERRISLDEKATEDEIRRKHADGNGLLVLYPVDPYSDVPAKNTNKQRRSLRDSILEVNPLSKVGSHDPSSNEVPPLFGFGFVVPLDVHGVLTDADRGTYVSVTPAWEEDPDNVDLEIPEDREKDFKRA